MRQNLVIYFLAIHSLYILYCHTYGLLVEAVDFIIEYFERCVVGIYNLA